MTNHVNTDLVQHIAALPLIDTHEHLHKEAKYVQDGPDVLADLFGMYIGDELVVAGAPLSAVERLLDASDPDIEARWSGVEAAWQLCQYSGYGEAVRYMAKVVYDIDTLTLEAIEAAGPRNQAIRQPGERLRLLRDVANLDHVQVDDFVWPCLPDASGPSFFLYDFSWVDFVSVRFDVNALEAETGVTTTNLKTLKQAMEALTAKYAPVAIAMKIQHAYYRTLAWSPRDDADAEKALQKYLAGEPLSEAERLCLGDWNLERGIEMAIKYHLPIKIHTGFLAGHQRYFTHPDQTRAGHLAPLLAYFPEATFVLMHIAYPYSDELIAIAKHFPGVYLDMCWAWSINPYHAADFVRRALHGLPLNKLFAFGGDCVWPTEVVGFAAQSRRWLTCALQLEITDAYLSEAQAIQVATRMMQTNQRAVFDIEGTRSAIAALGV
ncbi:MAG: amidohydrolase family protein [Anaerolineae bacterium]|nr:amidohydrolase family protein [Anaerolineae bacterium]